MIKIVILIIIIVLLVLVIKARAKVEGFKTSDPDALDTVTNKGLIKVEYDSGRGVRYIKIKGNYENLAIKEIEIYADESGAIKNVAKNKSVTLIQPYSSHSSYKGSKAVNGMFSTAEYAYAKGKTKYDKPVIELDLGKEYNLEHILIFSYQHWLHNSKIILLDEDKEQVGNEISYGSYTDEIVSQSNKIWINKSVLPDYISKYKSSVIKPYSVFSMNHPYKLIHFKRPQVTTPAPIITTPAPTTSITTPAPTTIITTPAPIITTPAPIITTPAPIITTPAPIITTPAPTTMITTPPPTTMITTPAPTTIITTPAPTTMITTPIPTTMISTPPIKEIEPDETPGPTVDTSSTATPGVFWTTGGKKKPKKKKRVKAHLVFPLAKDIYSAQPKVPTYTRGPGKQKEQLEGKFTVYPIGQNQVNPNIIPHVNPWGKIISETKIESYRKRTHPISSQNVEPHSIYNHAKNPKLF